MAQTVAFIFEDSDDYALAKLERLASAAGYGFARGVHQGHPDVVQGIEIFCGSESKRLEVLYLISDQINQDAFSIYEELKFSAWKSSPIRFFEFLNALTAEPERTPKYMVACTEWSATDEAIWLEGNSADLITYLKVVNTFGFVVWSPVTKRLQESDRYPMIFHFVRS